MFLAVLKDLNVLVELLFVTVKNAVQGHNMQARNVPQISGHGISGFLKCEFLWGRPPDRYPRQGFVLSMLTILTFRRKTRTYLPYEINLQNMKYIP